MRKKKINIKGRKEIMEDTIIDNLAIMIAGCSACIMVFCIAILAGISELKEMFKKHFKDEEKEN